jgi:hypothetical protein
MRCVALCPETAERLTCSKLPYDSALRPDRGPRILTADANLTRRPIVTKRPDPFDRILQAVTALGPFITALAGAALAGRTLGLW